MSVKRFNTKLAYGRAVKKTIVRNTKAKRPLRPTKKLLSMKPLRKRV